MSSQRDGPPPSVAILTSVHDPYDPRIFHKQARTLAAAGYHMTLLAPHKRDETVDGVRVWGVPPPRGRAGRPLVWLRLLGRALRLRADAYHFHDPELLPVGLLLAWITGRPVVYDAHEYYRDEIATRPWIPTLLRRPAAELVHAAEGFVSRRIAAVVAVNEHMAGGFRARGARRAVAVRNYPPLAYFAAGQTPPSTPSSGRPGRDGEGSLAPGRDDGGHSDSTVAWPVVAYVGLLTRDRGLGTTWEAGRWLKELVPGAEVRVIGRVDWSGLYGAVPRDPAIWQGEAATRFLGVMPARDVPAALTGVAAGWIPFRRTPNNVRTIPLKLLEYMAAGLPVVASDIGFIAGIVREANCGLLVPHNDAEAHARALAHLLTHPDEAWAMGARGRAAVIERYSWEAESARLLDLYAELTGGRSESRA